MFGGTAQTSRSTRSQPEIKERSAREGTTYTRRDGTSTPVDAAFLAWTSGDLNAMLSAVSTKTNNVDRHYLLQCIVEATYKRRSDSKMRTLCIQYSEKHLNEFPTIAPALKRQCRGVLPHVTTFQHYATVLTEVGKFDQAIEVCGAAIKYGLHDGTASGFEGRISRILKVRNR